MCLDEGRTCTSGTFDGDVMVCGWKRNVRVTKGLGSGAGKSVYGAAISDVPTILGISKSGL